jgi:hypothetical protein
VYGDADQNVKLKIREYTESEESPVVVPPAVDLHPTVKIISSTANLEGLDHQGTFCFKTLEDYNTSLAEFCNKNRINFANKV